jgi:hypothetical protein
MKFANPYENETRRTRTTIDIGSVDCAFLKSLHNRKGTLQTTINIILVKLTNELKRRNITSYDPDVYESAITGASINLGVYRSPDADNQSQDKTNSGNERPGTSGLAQSSSGRPSESPDALGAPAKHRSRKGKSTPA